MPDYVFLGKRSFAIEFKGAKGKQSPAQRTVQGWFESVEVPYYLARSSLEGQEIVKHEWEKLIEI
jgi:hypothetical protein